MASQDYGQEEEMDCFFKIESDGEVCTLQPGPIEPNYRF
jgi:hypothetical protein